MKEVLTKKELEQVEEQVSEFFNKLDFVVNFNVSLNQETVLIEAQSEEPRALIGEQGKVLLQIQRLLGAVLNKSLGKQFYIELDINDYKKKKIQYLKEMAKEIADKVVLTQQEKILFPMPSYQRRIIHLELADRRDVTTQSMGKEPERRVAIKPYP